MDHPKSDYFHDTIQCEISEGLALPAWATPQIVEQMRELKSKTFFWTVYTNQLKRLAIGLFFNDLRKKIQNSGNDLEALKKLNLYATVGFESYQCHLIRRILKL